MTKQSDPAPKGRKRKSMPLPTALTELSADFDRRLASFKDPGIRDRVDAVVSARGRAKRRPKAGRSF